MRNRPADPDNRCQRTGPFGQCVEERVPGTEFCPTHGGRAAANKAKRRMYDLAQAEMQHLYGQMADREDLLSLRSEVALIRAAILRFSNLMNDSETSFESKIATFNTLMLTAKALISECVKVEKSVGLTVDRASLLKFGADVIQICDEVLTDVPGKQDLLENIASRIIDAVKVAGETSEDHTESP